MAPSLTDGGREGLAAILRQDRRNAEAMLDSLSPDEREAFVAALGTIVRGIGGPPSAD